MRKANIQMASSEGLGLVAGGFEPPAAQASQPSKTLKSIVFERCEFVKNRHSPELLRHTQRLIDHVEDIHAVRKRETNTILTRVGYTAKLRDMYLLLISTERF